MFTKPLTSATRYILIKSYFLAIGWSYVHDLWHTFFEKIETTIRWNCISIALRCLQITTEHQDCPVFAVFLTKETSPKNISTRSYRFRLNFTNIATAIGGKSSRYLFWNNSPQCRLQLLRRHKVHFLCLKKRIWFYCEYLLVARFNWSLLSVLLFCVFYNNTSRCSLEVFTAELSQFVCKCRLVN